MHDALEKKKEILIEGANAMMLDIDFGKLFKDSFMGWRAES